MLGICHLSAVPCRKEPSDRSEMVNQLLFGESFEVLEEKGSWTLIKIHFDDYECWISSNQFIEVKKKQLQSDPAVSGELLQLVLAENHLPTPIVLGSSLPHLKNKRLTLGDRSYSFDGDVIDPGKKTKHSLEEIARWYLNAPYLWGGRSPFGIDCSGFTQMVFKLCGRRLRRDAWQQADQGKTVSFIEESKTGDLAFFDNEDGKIVHVGIILTPSGKQQPTLEIVHASGKVRIDRLDHHGIFNAELNKYTHRLRVIKSVSA